MEVKIRMGKRVKVKGVDVLGDTKIKVSATQAKWLVEQKFADYVSGAPKLEKEGK
jgi:hypothetical protein